VLADLEKLKSNLVANTKTSIYSIVGGVGSNLGSGLCLILKFHSLESDTPLHSPHNGFGKKLDNQKAAMVAIHAVYYNYAQNPQDAADYSGHGRWSIRSRLES
jgi:hypothetical protein